MALDSPLASPHRVILGFHIASGQALGPRSPCTTVRRAKSSQWRLDVQPRALAAAASVDADSPRLSSDDYFSDEEEEAGSPQGSVPIVIRDEEFYKLMLRARAVVNSRFHIAADAEPTAPAPRARSR